MAGRKYSFSDLLTLFAALKLLPSNSITENLKTDKYARSFTYDEISSQSGYFHQDENDEMLCSSLTHLIQNGDLEITFCYHYAIDLKLLHFALTDAGILHGCAEYGNRNISRREVVKNEKDN